MNEVEFNKYLEFIDINANSIARKLPWVGAFSEDDLKEAAWEQLVKFLNSSDVPPEGAIKLRLRGAMVDALRHFSHYNRDKQAAPHNISDECIWDNSMYSQDAETCEISLSEILKGLNERHRIIMTMYYGEDMTCQQIGEKLGVTHARIYQCIQEAMGKLKRKFAKDVVLG